MCESCMACCFLAAFPPAFLHKDFKIQDATLGARGEEPWEHARGTVWLQRAEPPVSTSLRFVSALKQDSDAF